MKVVFPLLFLACVCSLPAKAFWTLEATPTNQTYRLSMQQDEQQISLGFALREATCNFEVKHMKWESGSWSLSTTERQLSNSFPSLENTLWDASSLSYGSTSLSIVEQGGARRGLVLDRPTFSFAVLDMGTEALADLYIPYQRMLIGPTFLCSFHEQQRLASLVLEPSYSPALGRHLSSSFSLRFGPFAYHKAYRTDRWERYSSCELESDLKGLRILWVASSGLGYQPLFGGETQEFEHTYASRLGFTLWAWEWLIGWQQNLKGEGRAETQLQLSLSSGRISVQLVFRMQEGMSIRVQNGTSYVHWSEQGFSYHLELARGALEFRVLSDPKQLSIVYRFTSGRDTGFPQPN